MTKHGFLIQTWIEFFIFLCAFPQTPIAYRGMNKPFEAHLSDKVINVNNSAVILSECLNLTFKFFHVLQVSPVIISHNWDDLIVENDFRDTYFPCVFS